MFKINLLPPERKKEMAFFDLTCFANNLIMGFLASLIVFTLLLGGAWTTLNILINEQQGVIELRKSQEKTKLLSEKEEEIIAANKRLDMIAKKQKQITLCAPVLKELSRIVSRGIFLKSISYHTLNGQIALSGWADDRENLLFFESSLEDSPYFSNVKIPLADLIKQKDIDFSFDFKLEDTEISYKK